MNVPSDNILKIAKVIQNNDENCGFRIKARIFSEDDNLSDNELPYAFPLLPKMMHVLPKIGEAVLIISTKTSFPYGQRYYIGPLIHQPEFMPFDDFFHGATALHDGGNKKLVLPSLLRNPNSLGALPKSDEISFIGRKDCDLILGEKEVKLRCGVRLTDKDDNTKVLFNKTNPTYIKLKYHDKPLSDNTSSTATIVSENINLISTASKDYFPLSEKDDLITDEVMNEIISKAHPLPYGDTLIDFLDVFRKAFNSHTHAYSGLPPVQDITYINVNQYNLKDILSRNVRIN